MYPYTYRVTLRVFHPDIDPQVVTDTLEMQPGRTWKVGERRTTPAGSLLEGFYKESYWYSGFTAPDNSDFPGFLSQVAESLLRHRAFFNQIREAGGRVEFYVGLDAGGAMLGETLPHDLLLVLGQLGVDLSLDAMYEPDRVESA